MSISKKEIVERVDSLKKWQKLNSEKINSDSFFEGYNSAVNSEILFLTEQLGAKLEVKSEVSEDAVETKRSSRSRKTLTQ
jgi:hypothetical protein